MTGLALLRSERGSEQQLCGGGGNRFNLFVSRDLSKAGFFALDVRCLSGDCGVVVKWKAP